jgi:translation initiation factor IF-3
MQDGRNMTMMLGPSKAVLSGRADGEHEADGTAVETADSSPDAPAPGADPVAGSTDAASEQSDTAAEEQAAPDTQAPANA